MSNYHPFEYLSDDGRLLFARDYPAAPDAPAVLCLHGLTRNSADFEPLCDVLASRYRLIVPDQRGRGRSQWDSHPDNYQPLRYNRDMLALLEALDVDRVHIIGTSMGGIMGMLLAAEYPRLVVSLVLNDIGPEINMKGVRMIAEQVGQPPVYRDWNEAIAGVERNNAVSFPDYTSADWQDFARRICTETERGVVPDYDPAIGQVFVSAGEAAAPDLWPVFGQLKALPILVIRGALSTILKASTCERMRAEHPRLSLVELADRGHAPILNEAPALAAIESFLKGS